jgi:hypothetical protein
LGSAPAICSRAKLRSALHADKVSH